MRSHQERCEYRHSTNMMSIARHLILMQQYTLTLQESVQCDTTQCFELMFQIWKGGREDPLKELMVGWGDGRG